MQRYISFLLAGLFTMNVCMAQFSAVGGSGGAPFVFAPAANIGLDKVFVLNGLENVKISYVASNPSEWTWYKFDKNQADLVAVPSEVVSTATVLKNVEVNCGYLVESASGAKHSIYVVGYTPVNYKEIRFVSDYRYTPNMPVDSTICKNLALAVFVDAADLVYYTVKGERKILDRQHTLSWNTLEWNAANKVYDTRVMTSTSGNLTLWTIDAPLTDTKFTVSGDQYAQSFGVATSFSSGLYEAVAVKTNAQAEMQERSAKNELDRISTTGELKGSAPLDIQFKSYPSDEKGHTEWLIYETPEVSEKYIRRTDKDISYSFKESGTFLVKLFVSNATNLCKESASFSPQVLESFIDCPNFFTPRSSPGENDEFRVAYKSIVSFKGTIVNRWGNVLFEWSNPAQGWNGTYKGKAVSPGVYFYLIEARGSDGVVYKKKGDINLLE